MAKQLNTRAIAAKLSWQVIDKGQSLDGQLKEYLSDSPLSIQDRGLVQELIYGVCRWYGELDDVAKTLLAKPIRNKDRVVHFVLLVGLYQLRHNQTPDHAAVAETVAACKQLNKQWAKNLINGCLREYLRNQTAKSAQDVAQEQALRYERSHPQWMIEAIKKAWPDQLDAILQANNQRPPMCLRVNKQLSSRDNYLAQLIGADIPAQADPFSKDGIILDKAVGVTALPHFIEGMVSVQDTAAQLACDVLNVQSGDVVLDACAAPGGKTAHILEQTPNITMHALDVSERRCEQLHNTLARLNLEADVITADASIEPSQQQTAWTPPKLGYDRILIDSPCSGLGVIRRHPDIKHHRQTSDISALNVIQQDLITHLWSLLKPGGSLLYMTCSILPSENQQQIDTFLKKASDVMINDFSHPNALDLAYGKQTLPGIHSMDGFYYCLLTKIDAQASTH